MSAASSSTPSTSACPASRQALAQRGHPGLLAQGRAHRALHGLEGLHLAALTLQHLHHVQAKAAVHQAGQHAHFDLAEEFACELGRIGFSNALFRSPWQPGHDRARRLVGLNLSSEAAAVC